MKDRNYCVYRHTNKTNGKVYIGITGQSPENRWLNGHGYVGCTRFNRAIQKYGWDGFDHDILFTGLTKEQAEQKQIETIKEYNSTDSLCGYNASPGGGIGMMKPVYQYDRLTGNFIRLWSSTISTQAELNIPNADVSAVCMGKVKTSHNFYFSYQDLGNKLPDNIMEWINSNDCFVPVAQYDLDGYYIASYPSKTDAVRTVFGEDTTKRLQPNKTCFGYIWKDIVDNSVDYTSRLPISEIPKYQPHPNSEECHQYTLDGIFVCSFSSTTQAAHKLNGCQGCIAVACREHTKSYNSYWRYAKDGYDCSDLPNDELIHLRKGCKPVYKYDLNGNLVQSYTSVTEAANKNNTSTNVISRICSGKRRIFQNYTYRYDLVQFTQEDIELINKPMGHFRGVAQYDIDMNFIREFQTISEASRATGATVSSIVQCCKGKYNYASGRSDKTNRFKWKYI